MTKDQQDAIEVTVAALLGGALMLFVLNWLGVV
jgi:hypothetical protein